MTPTIGRIVHYYGLDMTIPPMAAIVASVLPDGTLNLGIWDHSGDSKPRRGVPFCDGSGERPASNFCEWPPIAPSLKDVKAAERAAQDGPREELKAVVDADGGTPLAAK